MRGLETPWAGLEPWLAALEPIDAQLAKLLLRMGADELTATAAALCGHWRGLGHACLPLDRWPKRLFLGAKGSPLSLPPAAEVLAALRASPFVMAAVPATGELAAQTELVWPEDRAPKPLVLDGANRLYLWRYYVAERELAREIRERLARPPRADLLARREELAPLWRRLFPASEELDLQALAAWGCLSRAFFVLSGGPGTGKTRTVARLVAAALALQPHLRVRLAAPTGKAAQRLNETLEEQWQLLGAELGDELPQRPGEAQTVHRLLGYLPRDDAFRFNAERRLEGDLFILDEASMIDVLLMQALLAALPPHATLVLLGDRDQLASVETGSFFADLAFLAAKSPPAASFVAELCPLQGTPPPEAPPAQAPTAQGQADGPPALLAENAVILRKSHRFAQRQGIGELADAIREGNADRALWLLDAGGPEVGRLTDRLSPERVWTDPARLLAPLTARWEKYGQARSPAEALALLAQFRLLCATRKGTHGVEGLNATVERFLLGKGWLTGLGVALGAYYPGRPILVRSNDYEVELFNGDLGVLWREEGQLWAFFDQGNRRLPLAKLPRHETAWAMTVHQSQGSEFDQVLLVLPPTLPLGNTLITRELLYTGLTRARHRVDLLITPTLLERALNTTARRASGLADRLLATSAETPA